MQYSPQLDTTPPLLLSRMADASAGSIIAGGRLLDSVADRDLQGTLEDIARLIHVRSEDLVTALAELSEAGWVTIRPSDDGRVLLCLADDAR